MAGTTLDTGLQGTAVTSANPYGLLSQGPALTFTEIEALWIENGGPVAWAPTMAAIALVESGGRVGAVNADPATGDYSIGLWQINYFGDLANSRDTEYGTPDTLQADPQDQVKAATALLGNGAGIGNWEGDLVGDFVKANGSKPLSTSEAVSLVTGRATASALANSAESPQSTDVQASLKSALSNYGYDAPIGPAQTSTDGTGPGLLQTAAGLAGSAAGSAADAAGLGWASELGTLLGDLTSSAFWKRVGIFALGLGLVVGGAVIFISTTKPGQEAVSVGAVAALA